ncbi:hypothetical protein [Paenisporosarcina antarctica]|nr:hypothetical protein [Paenisporosarcina antarctica]
MILVIFFISLLNYSPTTSYACSCVEANSVKDELDRSSAVFSGEVIEIVDKNKSASLQSSNDPISVLFDVDESWKGVNQTQIVVYTERSEASCGYEFSLNNEYLVYAQEIDGTIKASYCSKTSLLSLAEEDLIELGIGEKPTEQVSIDLDVNEGDEDSTNNYLLYSTSLIVVLLLAVAVVNIKRLKKKP